MTALRDLLIRQTQASVRELDTHFGAFARAVLARLPDAPVFTLREFVGLRQRSDQPMYEITSWPDLTPEDGERIASDFMARWDVRHQAQQRARMWRQYAEAFRDETEAGTEP